MKAKLILLAVICALLPMMWCGAKENDKSEDSSRFVSRMLEINTTAASTSGDRSAAQCSPSQRTVQPQQSAPQQSYQPADTLRAQRFRIEQESISGGENITITTIKSQPYQPAGEKVGDIVYHYGDPGIIIAIRYDTNEAPHTRGLLLSVEEGVMTWDNAQAWCQYLGTGWRLPTRSELKMISKGISSVNRMLQSNGVTTIDPDNFYWSGEEESSDNAWYVGMRDGNTRNYKKYYDIYVRAVYAF